MLKLIKPNLDYKEKYIDMIDEWQKYGEPFEPCIINYDCNNSIDKINYDAVIDVANNYSNGKIYDYDIDYFKSSDFYFIVDEDELIGMCELRHGLSSLGQEIKGNINCGIRPSKRNKGYCQNAINELIKQFKENNQNNIFMCFEENNTIMSKVANYLNFQYSGISDVEEKKILSYKRSI